LRLPGLFSRLLGGGGRSNAAPTTGPSAKSKHDRSRSRNESGGGGGGGEDSHSSFHTEILANAKTMKDEKSANQRAGSTDNDDSYVINFSSRDVNSIIQQCTPGGILSNLAAMQEFCEAFVANMSKMQNFQVRAATHNGSPTPWFSRQKGAMITSGAVFSQAAADVFNAAAGSTVQLLKQEVDHETYASMHSVEERRFLKLSDHMQPLCLTLLFVHQCYLAVASLHNNIYIDSVCQPFRYVLEEVEAVNAQRQSELEDYFSIKEKTPSRRGSNVESLLPTFSDGGSSLNQNHAVESTISKTGNSKDNSVTTLEKSEVEDAAAFGATVPQPIGTLLNFNVILPNATFCSLFNFKNIPSTSKCVLLSLSTSFFQAQPWYNLFILLFHMVCFLQKWTTLWRS
jgi:hypothetical protein